MRTEYLLEQENQMLWIGFILISAISILLIATIFTMISRKSLTPLNDAIDLKDNYIRKIEKEKREFKNRIEKIVLMHDSITNMEIIDELKRAL